MPAPITVFSDHREARMFFDKQRSALARVLPDSSVVIFVPASRSMGHHSTPLPPS